MSAPDPALAGAAHVVQPALTPVFRLSDVVALVNPLATCFGRVAGQAHTSSETGDEPGSRPALRSLFRPEMECSPPAI